MKTGGRAEIKRLKKQRRELGRTERKWNERQEGQVHSIHAMNIWGGLLHFRECEHGKRRPQTSRNSHDSGQ